jgi:uncharacterized membrane protein YhiD involved in acid resistance
MNNILLDVVEKMSKETTNSNVSVSEVLLVICFATVLGFAISYVYKKTFKGVTYTNSFVVSLVVMTIISSIVIMTVGSNLARAFGLVGTFSIIRFRNAIKDPKDIIFMFISLVTGMAVGTQNYHIAIIGIPFVLITVIILNTINYGVYKNKNYLLTIRGPKNLLNKDQVEKIISDYTKEYALSTFNAILEEDNEYELVYRVRLGFKKKDKDILEAITMNQNLSKVALISSENYVEY